MADITGGFRFPVAAVAIQQQSENELFSKTLSKELRDLNTFPVPVYVSPLYHMVIEPAVECGKNDVLISNTYEVSKQYGALAWIMKPRISPRESDGFAKQYQRMEERSVKKYLQALQSIPDKLTSQEDVEKFLCAMFMREQERLRAYEYIIINYARMIFASKTLTIKSLKDAMTIVTRNTGEAPEAVCERTKTLCNLFMDEREGRMLPANLNVEISTEGTSACGVYPIALLERLLRFIRHRQPEPKPVGPSEGCTGITCGWPGTLTLLDTVPSTCARFFSLVRPSRALGTTTLDLNDMEDSEHQSTASSENQTTTTNKTKNKKNKKNKKKK